jgi:hypothetical protein
LAAVLGALAAALLLAGCSGGTVAQWASATGAGANDYQLVSDAQHLRAGIRLHELRAVRTACEAFSADASTADGELPTPDHTLTDELNTAYEDDYVAGDDCWNSSSFTSAKFHRFEQLLAAGSAELARAEKLLGELAPGANSATGGSGGST